MMNVESCASKQFKFQNNSIQLMSHNAILYIHQLNHLEFILKIYFFKIKTF